MIHWQPNNMRVARCGNDCGRGKTIYLQLTPNQKDATCKTCKKLKPYKSPYKTHLADNKRSDEYNEYIWGICGTETFCVEDTTFDMKKVTCKNCLRMIR